MKKFIISAIYCFALIGVAFGQTNIQVISEVEGREIMTMIKTLHLANTSLAYRSAVVQRMLPEVNYFSDRLMLPTPHPIQLSDVNAIHVVAPWFSKIEDTNVSSPVIRARTAKIVVGGFIETTNFCFYFHQGNLWSIVNKVHHMERFDLYPIWDKTPSLINSNGAFQLATQWLASIDVDTVALEKKYGSKMKIDQAFFWNPPATTNKTFLPIFNVTWGEAPDYSVQVRILGTTKELMQFNMPDISLSHRPLLAMTNAIELVNIADPQLKQLQHP